MNKKTFFKNLLAASAFSAFALPAAAIGLGGNIGVTTGGYETDSFANDFDVDGDSVDFGFVLDTSKVNKLFGYRLNVNYLTGEVDDDFGNSLDVEGLYANNVFSFTIIENTDIRFWAGPSVALSLLELETSTGDEDGVGFAFGGSVGLDFRTKNNLDIGLEAGVRRAAFAFDLNDDEDFDDGTDLEYEGTEVYGKVNFIFRTR